MQTVKRVAVLALVGFGITGVASAQMRMIPSAQQMMPANPYWRMAPGMTQSQYLYNLTAQAQAMQQVPPWLAGYNPVAPLAAPMYGAGMGGINPYAPMAGGGFANPYTPGGYGGGMANPYTPGGGGGGYGGGGMPFPYYGFGTYIPPQGYFLQGAASVMNAYPGIIKGNEEARILREQANQAKLDTVKKRFELELYIKANTPSFTEEQAKIYKNTIKRIQRTNNPSEIWSGKSLNILLDDLSGAKNISVDPIPLSEETLKHVNVTIKSGNLGLLRNEGGFTWPTALQDDDIVPEAERKEIQFKARNLILTAANGDAPANLIRDLSVTVDKLRDKLLKKVNDIPVTQYMDAKRFLSDLDAARIALEQGDAIPYFKFQRWADGPKTVQEVTAYMHKAGLHFAPAVQGDEGAYQGLHSALATYDMAFHAQQQVAGGPAPAPKE